MAKTGLRCCLFGALALSVACGGGNGGTTSGTTGGSTTVGSTTGTTGSPTTAGSTSGTGTGTTGSATGTTTGTTGTCVPLDNISVCSPTPDNCCGFAAGTAICNNNTRLCQTVSQGTTTGTAGTAGRPTDSCNAGDAGSAGFACTSTYDCASPLYCLSGVCTAITATSDTCTVAGHQPTANSPCCGATTVTSGGIVTCAALSACGYEGQTCTDGTCCDNLSCSVADGGICVPSCGGNSAPCGGASDNPCCAAQGYVCNDNNLVFQDAGLTGSTCTRGTLATQQATTDAGTFDFFCIGEALCTAQNFGPGFAECALGTFCSPSGWFDPTTGTQASTVDPCLVDGLVCDSQFQVCRQPSQFEQCVQGGPACQTIANSTVAGTCSPPIFGQTSPGLSLCTQACHASADCVDPTTICTAVGSGVSVCTSPTACTDYYGTCNLLGTGDGVCAPVTQAGTLFGDCVQAATDGGAAGAACSYAANRQIGGFCDVHDSCFSGVCGAICNSGTGRTPACGGTQVCYPALGFNETTDAKDYGTCVDQCTLVGTGSGTCGTSAQGVPERCIAIEALGLTYPTFKDVCGALAPNPVAVGQSCDQLAGAGFYLDPCVDGAACLGSGSSATCEQLCIDSSIGQVGAAGGCPDQYTCTALVTGTNAQTGKPISSTHTGVCVAPAGGVTTATTGTTTGATSATTGTTGGATGTTGGTSGTATATGTTGGSTTGSTTGGTTGTGTTGGTTTGGTTGGGQTCNVGNCPSPGLCSTDGTLCCTGGAGAGVSKSTCATDCDCASLSCVSLICQ